MRHPLVICTILIACLMGAAHAVAQDIDTLRDTLRRETGEAYEQARAQAMTLPADEFDELLAPWETMRRDSVEHALAEALRIRREDPERAASFEAEVQRALENPTILQAREGPRYIYGFKPDPADSALVCEFMFKRRDLPQPGDFKVLKPMEHPPALDHLIALIRAREGVDVPPGISHSAVNGARFLLTESANWQADDATRNRLIEPVVEWYKRMRAEKQEYMHRFGAFQYYVPATVVLRQIATPESLQALNELIEWERTEFMPARGLQPWDDPTAREERSRISRRLHYKLPRELRNARRAGEDTTALEQEKAALEEQLRAVQLRCNEQSVLVQLHWMRDRVAAELAGEPLPNLTEDYLESNEIRRTDQEGTRRRPNAADRPRLRLPPLAHQPHVRAHAQPVAVQLQLLVG